MPSFLKFLISIAMPFVAALIGSRFTIKEIPVWYRGLKKPSFTPPSWLFGPAWTLLYACMGVAFYLIWTCAASGVIRHAAMALFLVQLVVNVLWSLFFFRMHNLLLALVDVAVLLALILGLTVVFWRIDHTAA
jgi:benzodiazapine receptor